MFTDIYRFSVYKIISLYNSSYHSVVADIDKFTFIIYLFVFSCFGSCSIYVSYGDYKCIFCLLEHIFI